MMTLVQIYRVMLSSLGLVICLAVLLFAQVAPGMPASRVPPWLLPVLIPSLNLGMEGVKRIAPRLPSWLMPFVNLGIGIGTSFLLGYPSPVETGLVVSGGSALLLDVTKNVKTPHNFVAPGRK